MHEVTRGTSPHDRLTRICADMTRACKDHPEGGDDVHYIICLDSRGRGGMVHDYEDDAEAVARLFGHLSALLRAQGKRLEIVTLGEGGAS